MLGELRAGRRPGDEPLAAAIARPDLRRALGLVLAGDPALPTGGGLRVPWSLGLAAAAFALGVALGRRTAGARGTPRWYLVARATPGGPTGLGPLGPVVAGLGLAGALALSGVAPRLADVEAAEPTRYFGLETLARPAPPPDLRWAMYLKALGYMQS